MSKILGIDLGTTNSAMAIVEGGLPKIIENAEGVRTTPSIVAISKASERLVGQLAKRQSITNPQNTIYGIKRFMGHRFEAPEVQKDKGAVPYSVERGEDGGARVKLRDKLYTPEEVSSMILQKLKTDAEAKLGEKITEAVITVPAYFSDAQRQATKNAGEIAGFTVKRIINEPTAAALAYGFNTKKNEKIAVYDFGGGTFDISVLEIGDDVIEVKSTDGDSHMGGEDIDQRIIKWIVDDFRKANGIDLSTDPLAVQRLKEAAEKAKHDLSNVKEVEINVPFITSDATGPKHLLRTMTRAELEGLSAEYVTRSIEISKRAVEASGFKFSEINEVIMVGGQTRMPAIVDAVRNLFGKEPNRSINPDEVVAIGAALQGGIMQGDVKDVLLLDVIPLSLGIETMGGVSTKLIDKNTTIPSSKTQVFSTAADNQTTVEIHVLQGERPMAADNKTLGKFTLEKIAPAPRGMPQVEVSFDVDVNGILSVTAKDKATNNLQSIKIQARGGLSQEDIDKMKKDAEVNAAEDQKKKEEVDVINNADSLIVTAEKSLKDAEGKVSAEIIAGVKTKIDNLKKLKDERNILEVKKATDELFTEMQKIGEAVYNSGPKAGEAGAPEPEKKDEKVRDADFDEGKSTNN
ncbi:MAG: molecular chaperone DnaK [bacterium]|nr:molecular chaperone DnaK [bacterium]